MRLARPALSLVPLGAARAAASCVPSYESAPQDASAPDAAIDAGRDAADAALPMSSDASDAGATPMIDASDAAPPSDASDASDAGPSVSLDGIVLLLHMDEPSWSGSGAVKDSSGQSNHGTAIGTATTTANGKFGRAGLFDGNTTSGSWVTIPSTSSLQASTGLTYCAWIYPTGLVPGSGASPGIIAKRQAATVNVAFTLFLWQESQASIRAYVDVPDQSDRFWSSAGFMNDTWYHLCAVYDGTQADAGARALLYVNGMFDSAATNAGATIDPSNTQDLFIANLPNGGSLFVGMIDEVAIWKRALSAAEVSALYRGGAL